MLASSFQDFEIIVGDNGRLGAAVVASRHDARLRYLAHPTNVGMAGNWNALLDAACGEYVALCSDDDRHHPDFLSRCVHVLDADPSIGIAFTNHTFASRSHVYTRPPLVAAGRHDDFALQLLKTKPVAASAALIRRQEWPAVRPLPDTAAADMVLFGRLADNGSAFFYIDEPLMTYAVHDDMLSSTDGFRSDRVTAWSHLHFRSRDAELERRRLLVESLVSRGRLRLQNQERADAKADLRRAARVGGLRWMHTTVTTRLAASLPAPLLAVLIRLRRAARRR